MLAEILSPEIIVVLILAVVLLFGAPKLPKMARSFGEANKEFKKAQREAAEEDEKAKGPDARPSASDDKITLSKSELDALLSEREARARREAETPPGN